MADYLLAELTGRDAMYKGHLTVDRHDRNVVLIFLEQLRVRFDVDLVQNKLLAASGGENCRLRVVTEMAAGTLINDYARFVHRYFLPANWEIRYKYRRRPYYILFLLGAALFMFKLIIRFTTQRGIPVLGKLV